MTSTWGREQIILLHPNCSKGALFCNFNSETYFSKVTKIDCYLNFAPWPQCEVANKYLCCSVTSRWDHEKIFLFLHDLKMRWRTNNFVAPWPQHEVTRKYFCCSVTSRWGHEKIFFFLRDLNMRSRTNIFVFCDLNTRSQTNIFDPMWPQHEVANKYFPCSMTSRWGCEKIFCCSVYRKSNISKLLLLSCRGVYIKKRVLGPYNWKITKRSPENFLRFVIFGQYFCEYARYRPKFTT